MSARWIENEDGTVSLAPVSEEYLTQAWNEVVPLRFRSARVADLSGAAQATVAEWTAVDKTPTLIVSGPVGVGKTHAALAAAFEWWAPDVHARRVEFAPSVELLDNLRPGAGLRVIDKDWCGSGNEEPWIEHYISVGLLVIDDLGGEKPSDWTAERLYLIINRRWLDKLPTIATTNLSPSDLKEQVGERTYDRIRDGAIGLRLSGESYRKPA